MVNFEIEVVRFDAEDVIATSTVDSYSECYNGDYRHLYVQSANKRNDLVAILYNRDGSTVNKTEVNAKTWAAIQGNTTNVWYYEAPDGTWTYCGGGSGHGTFNSGN